MAFCLQARSRSPCLRKELLQETSIKEFPEGSKDSKRRDEETIMATTTSVATKELVKYRVEDGVAVFELDDAPANTYTYDMMLQLDAAILKARMDESAHVIVLRGPGQKFFSAGASIPMLTKADPQFKYYFCLHAHETLSRPAQPPNLVIPAPHPPPPRPSLQPP